MGIIDSYNSKFFMHGVWRQCFVCALVCFLGIQQTLAEIVNETRQAILADLLNSSHYDSGIPPDFEHDTATNVTVQLIITNLYSVSESDMEYSLDMFFRQKWVDQRLAYHNRSSSEKIELDNKLKEKVWIPDTIFPTVKTGFAHDVTVPNKMMHIYPNGTVFYSMKLSLTLGCDFDLRKYPLDDQTCEIMVESYGYTIDNILFAWTPSREVVLPEVETPQFKAPVLLHYEVCRSDYGETGWFACLKAQIYLKRKVGYFIIQVFAPSVMIIVLSWFSFWIDAESVPARVTLGLLTVLTVTTQSAVAHQSLPQVSYIKAIDVWMTTCLAFVFTALLEYAYVNVLYRRQNGQTAVNYIVHRTAVNGNGKPPLPASRPRRDCFITYKTVDKLSRVVFPACFIIFNIIFWIYYVFADAKHSE